IRGADKDRACRVSLLHDPLHLPKLLQVQHIPTALKTRGHRGMLGTDFRGYFVRGSYPLLILLYLLVVDRLGVYLLMHGVAFLLCDLLVLFGSENGFVRRCVTIPRCFFPLCEYFFRLVLFLRLLLAFALGLCLPLLDRLSPRPHG